MLKLYMFLLFGYVKVVHVKLATCMVIEWCVSGKGTEHGLYLPGDYGL